ncbi:MAG: T9SS type A sorting domain-containing protein, partial [Bacteroidales bacterium]|nr:T9SS type A sorting domain-containing protein [Bacteroidales bacterium]
QAFRQGGVIPLRISSETELADEYGHTIPTPLSAPVIELIASELSLAVVPNPLSAQGEIRFSLPESGQISLEVYNALGQRIGILLNEARAAGSHQLNWDASGYAPGVYTLRLQSESEVRSVRVVKE